MGQDLETLIERLGDAFVGLFATKPFPKRARCLTVTFKYQGDIVETPVFPTPHEALEYAVNVLADHELREKE